MNFNDTIVRRIITDSKNSWKIYKWKVEKAKTLNMV
jgi:hypothetical protein